MTTETALKEIERAACVMKIWYHVINSKMCPGSAKPPQDELERIGAQRDDLLAACKELLVCIGSFAHFSAAPFTGTYPTSNEPEIVKARAAIAKAEGITK